MKNTGSHERFSELIGPYLRRELAVDDARELEEHLASCPDCRAEVEGARALSAGPERLTEAERASLHAAVTAAIVQPETSARVVPLRPRWAGAAKFMSAAAAIAVIAVAGIWASTSGNLGGSDDSGAGGSDSPAALEGADEGGRAAADPDPLFLDQESAELLWDATEEQDGGGDDEVAAEDVAGNFTGSPLAERALMNYAEEGPLFKSFADAYLAPVPEPDARRALMGLAKQAPADEFEDQVNDCGGGFLDRNPGSAISVAAVLGNFEGQEALVIGYVTTEAPSGDLNRYTYEVWRINDCSSPITTFGGALVR